LPERHYVVLGHVLGDEDQAARRPIGDRPQPVEYVAHALHRNMFAVGERDDALHPEKVGAAQLDQEREKALEQILPRRAVELENEAVEAVVVMRDRRENRVRP
jgi:hypothetical protein